MRDDEQVSMSMLSVSQLSSLGHCVERNPEPQSVGNACHHGHRNRE